MVRQMPTLPAIIKLIDLMSACCRGPTYVVLDQFLACFIPTSQELKKPLARVPYLIAYAPLLAVLVLATLPLALVGWILWIVCVNPFNGHSTYKYLHTKKPRAQMKKIYNFSTTNTCLLPECASRLNNMSHHKKRAKQIGQSIAWLKYSSTTTDAIDPVSKKDLETTISNGVRSDGDGRRRSRVSVVTEYPMPDFMCFQEVFDPVCAEILTEQLGDYFPHIVYDVRTDGLFSNFCQYNSGLAIASRYKIAITEFKHFKDSYSLCMLASKGVLMTKMSLGNDDLGRPVVGFIANLHLQAYQGDRDIHSKQLNDATVWLDDFVHAQTCPGDVVAFDVLCGDFNFDNMSPCCRKDYEHPIFKKYIDVCRVRPGLDHTWAIGTELRHIPLHDKDVQTPAGLQRILKDSFLRQRYLVGADLQTATINEICNRMPPVGENGRMVDKATGGKRRIDVIAFRNEPKVEVESINWISQLVRLTDHIPVSMSLSTNCPGTFQE